MTDDELRYAVEHYKPSAEVLTAMAGVRLLTVVGPSAVGKTSIMEVAAQKSPLLGMVGGITSRPQREDEKNSEYEFLARDAVIAGLQAGEYVQIAMMPTGDLYATRLSDYPKGKIGLMAVQAGVIPMFRQLFPDIKVVFIVPLSYEAWMQRFTQRELNDEDGVKRLKEAKTSLEFGVSDKNLHFILNDQIDKAAERLIQVTEAQPPDDEATAKQLVAQQYEKLKQRQV